MRYSKKMFIVTIVLVSFIVLSMVTKRLTFQFSNDPTTHHTNVVVQRENDKKYLDMDDFLNLLPRLKAEIVQELSKRERVQIVDSRRITSDTIHRSKLPTPALLKSGNQFISIVNITTPTPDKQGILANLSKILSEPIVNPFHITYKYNHPTSHCSKDTETLIVVPSAPNNFLRRANVRNSRLAKFVTYPKNRAKILFFLGSPDPSKNESKRIQEDIDKEQTRYGDIIQATFIDRYKNITMKAALLFHWSSSFCKRAKFLIRVDDDVIVSLKSQIAQLHRKIREFDHFILGRLRQKTSPFRDPSAKWGKYAVPESEWPKGKRYPPYVLGGSYALPVKTAGVLLEVMRRTKLLWLDDVFVTGVCTRRVGVPIFDDALFHFSHNYLKYGRN